jgi:hypothetical protein
MYNARVRESLPSPTSLREFVFGGGKGTPLPQVAKETERLAACTTYTIGSGLKLWEIYGTI